MRIMYLHGHDNIVDEVLSIRACNEYTVEDDEGYELITLGGNFIECTCADGNTTVFVLSTSGFVDAKLFLQELCIEGQYDLTEADFVYHTYINPSEDDIQAIKESLNELG